MKRIYTKPKRDLKAERIYFLKKYALEEWNKTRLIADQETSDKCSVKCVCGRLCTGLHEQTCQKFKNAVNTLTVKKLKHLWKEKEVNFPKLLK